MGQSRNLLRTVAWAVMVVALVNSAGCKKKGSSTAVGSAALPANVSAMKAEVLPPECQAVIEAIRKTGQPVTPEELDRWYVKPAPGENVAEIYTKAFALMVLPDRKTPGLPFLGSGTLPSPSDSLPAAMKKAIEEVLAQNQPALDLLCQTQKFSSSRYPVDLTEGVKAKLAHLSGVNQFLPGMLPRVWICSPA